MTHISIVGVGGAGSHAARQLRFDDVALSVTDSDRKQLQRVLDALEGAASRGEPRGQTADVVILAMPPGHHAQVASELVNAGVSVVSVSDDLTDAQGLLDLDEKARSNGVSVIAGAGFAPGFTCLLARLASQSLDEVHEIAVSNSGTGGPACARQHHRALKSQGELWLEGQWVAKRGGSGRELVWFPDPLGAMDCYRAALASPRLLQDGFGSANRISARLGATRRDRLTMGLPMLRKPHPDGGPGGVRVEVRGVNASGYHTEVYGAMHHPSAAAGIVSAVSALQIAGGGTHTGAGGLAKMAKEPNEWLRELKRRGLAFAKFSGSA